MQKSKRKTQPERFPLKISALILIVIAVAVFKGLQDFQLDPDTAPIQLDLPAATVSGTDAIQLMNIPEIDDYIMDIAFSEDSSSWYALGTNRLYKMELNGTESQPVASVSFPSEYEANTLAVYPGANQMAIGAMRINEDSTVTPAIIFVDLPGLQFIDYELASENQNNRGYSMELAFTPDGSQLYHLYNQIPIECSQSYSTLEYWDMNTHEMTPYLLPTGFLSDFMITDDTLALHINTYCSPFPGEDSHLIFYSDDGQELSFPSGGATGYHNLTVSADGTLFAEIQVHFGSNTLSNIHIRSHDELYTLIHDIEVADKVTSIAFSPDNRYLVIAADNNLHFINLQSGRVDESVQTGLPDYVTDVSFSPDGHYLIANGATQQIIWYLP